LFVDIYPKAYNSIEIDLTDEYNRALKTSELHMGACL
jgi:hypothetical protein